MESLKAFVDFGNNSECDIGRNYSDVDMVALYCPRMPYKRTTFYIKHSYICFNDESKENAASLKQIIFTKYFHLQYCKEQICQSQNSAEPEIIADCQPITDFKASAYWEEFQRTKSLEFFFLKF